MFDDPAFFDDEDTDTEEDPVLTKVSTAPSPILRESRLFQNNNNNNSPRSQRWWMALQSAYAGLVQKRRPSPEALAASLTYLTLAHQRLRQAKGIPKNPPQVPAELLETLTETRERQTQQWDVEVVVKEKPLTKRRLLIRLLVARSEVLACLATACRWSEPAPTWRHGVQLYQESLDHIHQAIVLADQEVAQAYQTCTDAWSTTLDAAVVHDATIVETCIGHLVAHKNRYERAVEVAADRIRTRIAKAPLLTPEQYAALRQKLQQHRSYPQRPAGSLSFRQRRALEEAELAELEQVQDKLEQMHIPEFGNSTEISTDLEDFLG